MQPLAARVAGRILCLHGGLGAGLVDIDQIRALQRRRRPPPAGRGAVVCASRCVQQPGMGAPAVVGCRLSTGGARRPLSISHDGTTADDLLLMDILWSDPTDRPQTALPSCI